MGLKFIIKENLRRVVDYEVQGSEVILKDRFEGYNIVEDSESSKLSIYFRDIDRNLNVVQRFFEIDRNDMDSFVNIFSQYEDKPTDRYVMMLKLKKLCAGIEAAENIYNNNYLFFVSGNVTLKEWIQFVGYHSE